MKKSDSIHYLLESPQFNSWVKSGQSTEHTFTSSDLYLSCDKQSIDLAVTMLSTMTFTSTPIDLKTRTSIAKNIHKSIAQSNSIEASPATNRKWSINMTWLSIAASFIVLFAFVYNFQLNDDKLFQTDFNEILTTQLSDGSVVSLDANSKIEILGDWSGINVRRVKLENSAFFSVAENKGMFSVETDKARIDVLGTEFFVNEDVDILDVVVKKGKVRVVPNGSDPKDSPILTAGDRIQLTNNGDIVKSKLNIQKIDQELAWMKGQIVFDRTSFHELSDMLEERYGKSVTVHPSLLNSKRSINGTFPNKSLPFLLESIETALDVQIDHTEQIINISYTEN